MSDLTVGDLVFVLRNHCTQEDQLIGTVQTVLRIEAGMAAAFSRCGQCNALLPQSAVYLIWESPGVEYWAARTWLRKIPPLADLEGSKRDEPIKEPA